MTVFSGNIDLFVKETKQNQKNTQQGHFNNHPAIDLLIISSTQQLKKKQIPKVHYWFINHEGVPRCDTCLFPRLKVQVTAALMRMSLFGAPRKR